jgi:hypothetical protein
VKFAEEQYAKELHRELQRVIGVNVSVSGSGCHWDCRVEWNNRSCRIHCFDQKGPEYLVILNQGHQHAIGRTAIQKEVVDSAKEWLSGLELPQLHQRFAFIDRQKRSLEKLVEETTVIHPELEKIEHRVDNKISDLSDLWFRTAERSCKVSYWGKKIYPDAVFHWDGHRLFSFPVSDKANFAVILKKWLCDSMAPSALQKEFPSLNLSKAAAYYEQGRGIEGEFVESWDQIEEFYREFKFPWVPPVLEFLAQMRKRGFDHTLRAGQSMHTLVLSRSRRHGLKQGQSNIAFHFRADGMDVEPFNLPAKPIRRSEIELNPPVETLLNQLADIEVN